MKEKETSKENFSGKKGNALSYILFTALIFAPTLVIVLVLLLGGGRTGRPENTEGTRDNIKNEQSFPEELESEAVTNAYMLLTENAIPVEEIPSEYRRLTFVELECESGGYAFYFVFR